MKKVFLENLPRKGITNVIDWFNTKGCKLKFIYDNIEGEIEIVDVKREGLKTMIGLKYSNYDAKYIFSGNMLKGQLGEILRMNTSEYTLSGNYSSVEVTERKDNGLISKSNYDRYGQKTQTVSSSTGNTTASPYKQTSYTYGTTHKVNSITENNNGISKTTNYTYTANLLCSEADGQKKVYYTYHTVPVGDGISRLTNNFFSFIFLLVY
jgi:hypothetical protein